MATICRESGALPQLSGWLSALAVNDLIAEELARRTAQWSELAAKEKRS